MSRARHAAAVLTSATIALAPVTCGGCGASLRRFPMRDAVWHDHDTRAFSPRPPEWYSPYVWDGVDNSVFRPLSDAFALELSSEAVNVNAMDEVPDSSWYENRLARAALSPETVARGACDDVDPATPGVDDDVRGPFTITRGKPDGSNPGFFVRDARGVMYLMKPDGDLQHERPSASDAIGAAVFWAAGYHVPCNRVVFVERSDLVLDPDAEVRRTDGHREPLTEEIVDDIVEKAMVAPDGRLRFSLSQFIDGEPIAPWTYEGTWDADPNDVIPHQHRRDVRAMYVLSSWLSHIDSRQENTMAAWIEGDGGRGHVRHYMIDFSDTLGILFTWDLLARRFGHSGYFDVGHMAEDFLTLGLLDRPWHHAELGPTGTTLGYYDVDDYDPDGWRPGYPNPAYERMTEADAAWMARILARFSDEHVRALVARGRFADASTAAELDRILRGRRDRALERWLTRLSPLTDPVVDGDRLCVEDRAISSGIRARDERRYTARAWIGEALEERALPVDPAEGAEVCVELARADGASSERPAYVITDVIASSVRGDRQGPVRVHAYDLGERVRIVGIERPSGDGAPR